MTYNKATVPIKNAVTEIAKKLKNSSSPLWIDKWEGKNGKISQVRGLPVSVSVSVHHNGVIVHNGQQMILTAQDALNLATSIDALNVGADHLEVKNNPTWKSIYRHDTRGVSFVNAAGAMITRQLDTIPCHNCGIVLPPDCIQVDHHMPQAGGEDLYALKTLRALGLTSVAASGSKGMAVLGRGLNNLRVNPKERARGNYDHLVNPTAAAKWSTNDSGTAFLSLLAYVKDGLNSVKSMCKNNLLNLTPLCGACNREKSDWIKPLQ
jgi:hypothetical protein